MVRYRSVIGYIAPADKLNGKDKLIFKERDRKLDSARQAKKIQRAEIRIRMIGGDTPPIQAAAAPTRILDGPILGTAA